MKKACLGMFIGWAVAGCNTQQNNDAVIDELHVTADSTSTPEYTAAEDAEFAPYGKAKAEQLSAHRSATLQKILQTKGIPSEQAVARAGAIGKAIGFNEWDIVEEGESVQSTAADNSPVSLTSLLFGPFDGNGRGYSIVAIKGENIYLSEDFWRYTSTDSAYNIQMAFDKKIEVEEENLSIISPTKGKMILRKIE